MRFSTSSLLVLGLAACSVGATVLPAAAQVTIDLRALDPLPQPGAAPARPAPSARPAPPARPPMPSPPRAAATPVPAQPQAEPQPQRADTAAPATARTAQPADTGQPTGTRQPAETAQPATPAARPPVVALPGVTPPPAALAPVPGASAAPPAPPATAPAAQAAPAAPAVPLPQDLRLTFPAGATELTQADNAAIKRFAGEAAASESASFNVMAYAAGQPDDPSTARRLSLSRALAVRTALMAEGIPSTRIYVRALGSQAGQGPADRVDVSALGANASTPASATAR
ncbi:MAG: OmpA family protein [Acetobacteraceae bacterium]